MELVSPPDGALLPLLRSDWKSQILERSKRKPLPEPEWGLEDRMDHPEAVDFIWKGEAELEYGLDLARDEAFRDLVKSIVVKGNRASLCNLEVGRRYFWRVRDGKRCSPVRCFRTSGDTPRYIQVPGGVPANMRDAGGKMTAGGRRTRQGMIFRGSEMNRDFFMITPEGIRFMREELRIRTDLDMRYAEDTSQFTASPLGTDVQWIRRPVNAYNSFTPEQNILFRDTIRVFADAGNYPIYLHCSGGSDRTGEIVFLLDMLLEVDEERAFLDYEASGLAYYPRPRSTAYFQNWLKTIQSMSLPGESHPHQVRNYLKLIGVTEEELASIQKIMLE